MKKIAIGLVGAVCAVALASCGNKDSKKLKEQISGKEPEALAEEVIEKYKQDNNLIQSGLKVEYDFSATFKSSNDSLKGNAKLKGSALFVDKQGLIIDIDANITGSGKETQTNNGKETVMTYSMKKDAKANINYSVTENKLYADYSLSSEMNSSQLSEAIKSSDAKKIFLQLPNDQSSSETETTTEDKDFSLDSEAIQKALTESEADIKKFLTDNKDKLSVGVEGNEIVFTFTADEKLLSQLNFDDSLPVINGVPSVDKVDEMIFTIGVDGDYVIKSASFSMSGTSVENNETLNIQLKGSLKVSYDEKYTSVKNPGSYQETDISGLFSILQGLSM